MSRRATQIARNPSTGAGIAGAAMEIRKVSDNSLVDSVSTDAQGRGSFDVVEIGNPGPIVATYVDSGGNTKVHSGEITGQIGGFLWVDAINDMMQGLGVGKVVAGYLNELAPSANGANMVIAVATGAAILADGYGYVNESSGTVTLTTSNPTNPRIDRIVLRLTREGQATQGVVTLAALAGTPAASPVAPALTQDGTTWETTLAQVRVDAAVSAIAGGKVTDERAFTFTPPANAAAGDILYLDANRKLARLPVGTSGQILQLSSGIPSWVSSSGISGITVQEGDVTVGSGITTLDLDAADFAVTVSPAGEANIRLTAHEITRTGFDNTLRSTASTGSYTDQVSVTITLDIPGTWTIEAVGMARIASDGGNVDVRISVDGTTTTISHSAPDVSATPVFIRGSKASMTTASKIITLSFKSNSSGTVYMSDAVLIVTAYRT